MSRKESLTTPEGNGPIPMLGGITLKDFRREVSEMRGEILRQFKKNVRSMDRRLASLKHGARQPRLTMGADGPPDKKTCERTEGAAKAVQAMHGDGFSAKRI